MSKNGFFSMKRLNVALCLLFVVSLGFNVNYFNTVKSEKSNDIEMYKYYMEMHELTFSNVFVSTGGQEIREYIKHPDHISNIIEGIELAEFQYLVASKYVPNEERKKKSISTLQSKSLINGYLHELRTYRAYLYNSNNKNPYGDINQIYMNIDDLIKISNWLTKNTDFLVYTDQDFNREVYPLLQSDLKKNFFR
jgi:hypothetical protein